MKLCPLCEAEYANDLKHCVRDGERLVSVSNQRDELLGTVLNGRYRLQEKIGEGGMGAVYRGMQEPIGRAVAVKVLQQELASDKTAVRRFFNEARVVSRLRHPNTVTLYDFGQSEETEHLFIVMEFLSGTPLGGLIHAKDLDLPGILEIVDQICQSLEEAHEKGIIHRDLKPDNVFIDAVGTRNIVKVLDFGLAKVPDSAEHLTRTGTVFGTPAYMSPEQAQGHPMDHLSDIYALGIILFELLAGEPPFTGESIMQVALKQVTEQPPNIVDMTRFRPLPLGVSAVVMDMLEKDPACRPPSIQDIRKRLLKVARKLPGVVVKTGQQQKVKKLPRQETLDTMPEAWKGGVQAAQQARTILLDRADAEIPDPSWQPTESATQRKPKISTIEAHRPRAAFQTAQISETKLSDETLLSTEESAALSLNRRSKRLVLVVMLAGAIALAIAMFAGEESDQSGFDTTPVNITSESLHDDGEPTPEPPENTVASTSEEPPPVDSEPQPPLEVTLRVETEPQGATVAVVGDTESYGPTPTELTVANGALVELSMSLAEHQTQTYSLTANTDQILRFRLQNELSAGVIETPADDDPDDAPHHQDQDEPSGESDDDEEDDEDEHVASSSDDTPTDDEDEINLMIPLPSIEIDDEDPQEVPPDEEEDEPSGGLMNPLTIPSNTDR